MDRKATIQFERSIAINLNLAVCPPELIALDTNAELLWRVLLKKVGVTISQGEHIEDKRAWVLRNIGLPDLSFRLECQQKREGAGGQDDTARAGIWYHVAEASSAGDSISDISQKNSYLLNAFILDKALKFPFPEMKKESGVFSIAFGAVATNRGRPRKSDAEKRHTRAARQRRFRNAKKSRLGQSTSC